MDEHPVFYTVLGVPPTATPAEITHAFRAKLRALHPDSRSANVDATELRRVLDAYAVLRDPIRRAGYDRGARDSHGPPAPDSGADARPPGPVEVPVTYLRHQDSALRPRAPLWVGPLRWHR
jgi:curved DNA-binding protein CbpA